MILKVLKYILKKDNIDVVDEKSYTTTITINNKIIELPAILIPKKFISNELDDDNDTIIINSNSISEIKFINEKQRIF